MRSFISVFAALWLVAASAVGQSVIPPPPVAPAPPHLAETVAQARALVQQDLAAKGYPGIAVAVMVDGVTVWSEGFGYADLDVVRGVRDLFVQAVSGE